MNMPPEIITLITWLIFGLGISVLTVILGAMLGKFFAAVARDILGAFGL
jgi:hypothetical protein